MTDIDVSTSRRGLLAGALGLGGIAALTVAGPASGVPIPAESNSNFYLTIPEIPGESSDRKHPGSIELLTWGFGVTSTVDPLIRSGGGGAGKSKPADLVVVARTSKASPKMYQFCCSGKHFKKVVLSAVRLGDSPAEYLTVTLQNAILTSYEVAPGESDGYPLDVAHVSYAAITYSYVPQNPDGSPGTPVTVGFDFGANKTV